MRVAVVGAGVSGLVTAYLLDEAHDVVLFEAAPRVGGHTRTVDLRGSDGATRRVDTGFVVFNEETYPGLLRLFRHLGVRWKDSDMSFSVSCERSGLEYAGTSLSTLFAQPRNLASPRFLRMLADIVRFNRRARRLVEADTLETPTLRAVLDDGGYGRGLVEDYLVPMASAVWSSSPDEALDAPAGFLLRFFHNHGFLTADGHLAWKVVEGGSDRYVDALLARFGGELRTSTPVVGVRRECGAVGGVTLRSEPRSGALRDAASAVPGGSASRRGAAAATRSEGFDAVVLACPAHRSLALLEDPSPEERAVLGAFRFARNDVVVHTDASLLPEAPRARASWNYHVPAHEPDRVVVTYDSTRLQGLGGPDRFLVTLNRGPSIDPDRVHLRFSTGHPIFTVEAVAAQDRHAEISGGTTHHAGAWWRNGFHEDGVWSAFRVARALGVDPLQRLRPVTGPTTGGGATGAPERDAPVDRRAVSTAGPRSRSGAGASSSPPTGCEVP